MPRKPKDTDPAEQVSAGPVSDVDADGAAAAVADDNEHRSSETLVIAPAEDEPVRHGGYVLTDKGWVLEATLEQGADDESAEQEQE